MILLLIEVRCEKFAFIFYTNKSQMVVIAALPLIWSSFMCLKVVGSMEMFHALARMHLLTNNMELVIFDKVVYQDVA